MSDVTVFISAYDPYAACWPVLCYSIARYWPDCPWPIQFVTNYLDAPCGEPAIKVGDHRNWTHAMQMALTQLQTDFLLLLAEDYWLTDPVDTKSLVDFASMMVGNDLDYLLLVPGSQTYRADLNEQLGVFADDSAYRVSLQASIWRIQAFLNLLNGDETIWQFEINGTNRSRASDRFVGVRENKYLRYVQTCHPDYEQGAVVKAKWTPSARRYIESENLIVDLTIHPDGTRNG